MTRTADIDIAGAACRRGQVLWSERQTRSAGVIPSRGPVATKAATA